MSRIPGVLRFQDIPLRLLNFTQLRNLPAGDEFGPNNGHCVRFAAWFSRQFVRRLHAASPSAHWEDQFNAVATWISAKNLNFSDRWYLCQSVRYAIVSQALQHAV